MEITKIPAEILKTKAKAVATDDIKSGKYTELVLDMKKAMVEYNGVGLAANQLGREEAIFVIDAKTADAFKVPTVFFNPEITDYSKEIEAGEEGCLSIPGFYVEVPRSKKVMLKAIDEEGNKLKIKARGFLARVFQHETDHLNGLVIKDRLI